MSESFGFTGPYVSIYGITQNFPSSLNDSPLFLQMREEIVGQFVTIGEISGFYGIFKIFLGDLPKPRYPSQGTQATLTQETKKV